MTMETHLKVNAARLPAVLLPVLYVGLAACASSQPALAARDDANELSRSDITFLCAEERSNVIISSESIDRRLRGLARSLKAVSPLATVARGYALITREDGTLVRSVNQVKAGDAVNARLTDGTLKLRAE